MKKIIKIVLITILLTMKSNLVFAVTVSPVSVGTGEESPGTPIVEQEEPYDLGTKRYACYYNESIGQGASISINAYDMSGKSVIPNKVTTNDTFKAGTWIGVNATEVKTASWSVTVTKLEELRKKITCVYKKDGQKCVAFNTITCGGVEKIILANEPKCTGCPTTHGSNCNQLNKKFKMCTCYYYECKQYEGNPPHTEYLKFDYNDPNAKCPQTPTESGYDGYKLDEKASTEAIERKTVGMTDECRSLADQSAASKVGGYVDYPSNKLKFIATNDFNNADKKENVKTVGGVENKDKRTKITGSNGDTSYGSITAYYEYGPKKVCINIKTAEVKYEEDCTGGSYKIIPNGTFKDGNENVNYWHYFIPLNAKSDSKFYVSLSENKDATGGNDGAINIKQCESVMEAKGSEYPVYIKPINGSYSGNYNSDHNQLLKDGKCYVAITINFKVAQKFYDEEKNNKDYRISGYGFYFRQIDIAKPFNSTPKKSSLWYTWYDEYKKSHNNKEPNFNNSFNEITYQVIINNPKALREDNKGKFYTSWDDMNLNGKSNFLTSNNRKNTGKIYKLGCGPANSDWDWCKQ